MCSKEIKQFFPWSTNNAEGKQTKSPYKTQYQLIVMNDDIYVDLEKLIAKERTEDQYTKVLVEGLELLNEESDTNTEIAPKAMLIHTGNSDVSMSGISTASKSTTGSVRWNDEAEDKERTSESMKQIKQQKCLSQEDATEDLGLDSNLPISPKWHSVSLISITFFPRLAWPYFMALLRQYFIWE